MLASKKKYQKDPFTLLNWKLQFFMKSSHFCVSTPFICSIVEVVCPFMSQFLVIWRRTSLKNLRVVFKRKRHAMDWMSQCMLANNQVSLFIICITNRLDSIIIRHKVGPSMNRILFASNDKCSIYLVVYEYTYEHSSIFSVMPLSLVLVRSFIVSR
jgi:hypothetical protein